MSFAPIEPAKDPRSFEQKNPVKGPLQRAYKKAQKKQAEIKGEWDDAKRPILPSAQEKVGKSNPRSPRSPEDHDKASDLYKKAREEHSAKTEEEFQQTRGHDEEEHYGGGGADIDLGGSGTESETMAYSKFYAGPHSMFQVRKEQPQAMPREED